MKTSESLNSTLSNSIDINHVNNENSNLIEPKALSMDHLNDQTANFSNNTNSLPSNNSILGYYV